MCSVLHVHRLKSRSQTSCQISSDQANNYEYTFAAVCFLVVFDFLFVLFKISWWPSAGKVMSFWLCAKPSVFLARLVSGTGCGIRLYRQVPTHCLFSTFETFVKILCHCLYRHAVLVTAF